MLEEAIKGLAAKHVAQKDIVATEEGTKNALVMPFLAALGYDVFNPAELIPEFTADVGTKKGEKVDYAIMSNDTPVVLIECKSCNIDLNSSHTSQLFRYFSVTDARFSILTNGVEYRFYSDLDKQNCMDDRPFLSFNIHDFDDNGLSELAKFGKDKFDTDSILDTASSLKYLNLLKVYLKQQFDEPTEEFVRFVGKQVFKGKMTQSVYEMFQGLTKRAAGQVVSDRMRRRIKDVFDEDQTTIEEEQATMETADAAAFSGIETLEDELLGHRIIQAIVAESVDPDRVAIRDAKSYCAILFDDNNRRPLVRLHFNSTVKRVSFFDQSEEEIIQVNSVADLYRFKDRVLATVHTYL